MGEFLGARMGVCNVNLLSKSGNKAPWQNQHIPSDLRYFLLQGQNILKVAHHFFISVQSVLLCGPGARSIKMKGMLAGKA